MRQVRLDSSLMITMPSDQDVLVSIAAPLFTHQKEARTQAKSRHPQTEKLSRERAKRQPGSIGFRQPIRTKVLSYHGNFTGA